MSSPRNAEGQAATSRKSGTQEQDDDEREQADGDQVEEDSSTLETTGRQPSSNVSLIEYYGPNCSHCGYCGQPGGGRRSYDMNAFSLRAADYQELLDRGWRRSGCYCYWPINKTTCCPNYSIVCRATEFRLTRSHRKCIEKVISYLASGDVNSRVALDYSRESTYERSSFSKKAKSVEQLKLSSKLRDKRYLKSIDRRVQLSKKSPEEVAECIRKKWEEKKESRLPLESYLFPTAAMLTNDKCKEEPEITQPKHKLEIEMLYVDSERCRRTREEQHDVIVRYQKAVHKEKRREWTMSRFCDFLVDSPIITEPLTGYDYLDRSKAKHDTDSLCVDADSTTSHIFIKPPPLPSAYGTYHCNYRLDGKLIATGVLDVLPRCITTVYFFYDPDFAFLNLGIFSALVEIAMVRSMSRHFVGAGEKHDQLVNYYLGFYVHECKKMHYKTRFEPSYLLCSRTFRYVPTKTCLQMLVDRKYADFSEPLLGDEGAEESRMQKFLRVLSIPLESPIDSSDTLVADFSNHIETTLGHDYVDLFVGGYLFTYSQLVGPTLTPRIKLKVDAVHRALIQRFKRAARAREAAIIESDGGDETTTRSLSTDE